MSFYINDADVLFLFYFVKFVISGWDVTAGMDFFDIASMRCRRGTPIFLLHF